MLVSDYNALQDLIPQYKILQGKVEEAKRLGQKIKQARANDMLFVAAESLLAYLQEMLCKASPGKAVRFLTAPDVQKFVEAMEPYHRAQYAEVALLELKKVLK